MADFKRTYRTGRGVLHVVAYFGWAVAAVGLFVFGVGFLALLGAEARFSAAPELVTIASGLVTLLAGLGGVAAAQGMQAGFDTADMTREMLTLARRSAERGAALRAPQVARITEEPGVDDTPPMPANPRLRAEAAPRPEPLLKTVPKTRAAPRPHPIFSAKPPS